ncbi:MAG: hypothetical protein ABGX47_13280 [Martelella sp.]|uniref:hypothetical protein n=1 Tax=Martelella sp. TaxID=1969699 RepID=UPI003242595C
MSVEKIAAYVSLFVAAPAIAWGAWEFYSLRSRVEVLETQVTTQAKVSVSSGEVNPLFSACAEVAAKISQAIDDGLVWYSVGAFKEQFEDMGCKNILTAE